MINKLPESTDSVLGFEVSGKVSLEQEKEIIDSVNQSLENAEKVSIVVVLHEKAKWGVSAGIEDLKWVITHLDRLNRIAIVSDSKVYQWLTAVDSPFAKLAGIKEKHFTTSEIDTAWGWAKEE